MLNLANNMGIMPGTTICGLADGAAWPIKNALSKFRGELEQFIKTHQSPANLVTRLQQNIAEGKPADDGKRVLPILSSAPAGALHSPGSGSV
jgi:NADH-quinone oxidoreductase subunit F